MANERGITLAELLTTLAITGLMLTITISASTTLLWRASLRAATVRIHAVMAMTKEDAVATGRHRGMKFLRDADGGWSYAIYADGDGDGVMNADIASGVDRLVAGPEVLLSPGAMATIGIPSTGLPDPDGGGRILAEASPVQFNRSVLCSFSPDGSGTPGSVYVRTLAGDAAVVRCSGDGGRLSVLILNRLARKWRSFS
ncbi:MAG TPA: hypothetical protein VJZ00_11900 [Thermoanaerobaculia bacterium]|nr:hypothetical protein [Thermoanaerobaculia bacterium]